MTICLQDVEWRQEWKVDTVLEEWKRPQVRSPESAQGHSHGHLVTFPTLSLSLRSLLKPRDRLSLGQTLLNCGHENTFR